jgi:transposase
LQISIEIKIKIWYHIGMETVVISQVEYEEYRAQKEQIAGMQRQIDFLMAQMRLARHKQFGSTSEKSEYDQLSLFNEAEATFDEHAAEPEISEVQAHHRKKAAQSQGKLPEDLPVEIVEHTLPEEEQVCPACGDKLHVIGKNVREVLKLIPAKAVIERHVQYVYGCRDCEKNACTVPIVKAKADPPLIKGSIASAEAVAQLMTQKFVMGAPLYRQEQEWEGNGVLLSRQTMSNWLLKCTDDYLMPIYDRLHERLIRHEVLHADETTLQVLHEPGKPPQSKSYMWLYRTSGDADPPIVLYEYQPDRRSERPQEFLKGFRGYLHTDGYSGYHCLPEGITVVGCWAHARRKFDEALKGLPEKARAGSLALRGKQYCDRLFAHERKFVGLSAEERRKKRDEHSKPVMAEFFRWLQTLNVSGKSAFGSAVRYALEQWEYLARYLLDGRLEISNNRAERSIKPFVIARKNFLFANTPRGAKASAIMYSLIETAKENRLNPYEYLVYILKKATGLNMSDPEQINTLLPEYAPEACKAPTQVKKEETDEAEEANEY